jgi:hypothetical protein
MSGPENRLVWCGCNRDRRQDLENKYKSAISRLRRRAMLYPFGWLKWEQNHADCGTLPALSLPILSSDIPFSDETAICDFQTQVTTIIRRLRRQVMEELSWKSPVKVFTS